MIRNEARGSVFMSCCTSLGRSFSFQHEVLNCPKRATLTRPLAIHSEIRPINSRNARAHYQRYAIVLEIDTQVQRSHGHTMDLSEYQHLADEGLRHADPFT